MEAQWPTQETQLVPREIVLEWDDLMTMNLTSITKVMHIGGTFKMLFVLKMSAVGNHDWTERNNLDHDEHQAQEFIRDNLTLGIMKVAKSLSDFRFNKQGHFITNCILGILLDNGREAQAAVLIYLLLQSGQQELVQKVQLAQVTIPRSVNGFITQVGRTKKDMGAIGQYFERFSQPAVLGPTFCRAYCYYLQWNSFLDHIKKIAQNHTLYIFRRDSECLVNYGLLFTKTATSELIGLFAIDKFKPLYTRCNLLHNSQACRTFIDSVSEGGFYPEQKEKWATSVERIHGGDQSIVPCLLSDELQVRSLRLIGPCYLPNAPPRSRHNNDVTPQLEFESEYSCITFQRLSEAFKVWTYNMYLAHQLTSKPIYCWNTSLRKHPERLGSCIAYDQQSPEPETPTRWILKNDAVPILQFQALNDLIDQTRFDSPYIPVIKQQLQNLIHRSAKGRSDDSRVQICRIMMTIASTQSQHPYLELYWKANRIFEQYKHEVECDIFLKPVSTIASQPQFNRSRAYSYEPGQSPPPELARMPYPEFNRPREAIVWSEQQFNAQFLMPEYQVHMFMEAWRSPDTFYDMDIPNIVYGVPVFTEDDSWWQCYAHTLLFLDSRVPDQHIPVALTLHFKLFWDEIKHADEFFEQLQTRLLKETHAASVVAVYLYTKTRLLAAGVMCLLDSDLKMVLYYLDDQTKHNIVKLRLPTEYEAVDHIDFYAPHRYQPQLQQSTFTIKSEDNLLIHIDCGVVNSLLQHTLLPSTRDERKSIANYLPKDLVK